MQAVRRVHDEHADVGALHRAGGAQRGVKLDVVFDLAALAQARRVDEDNRLSVVAKRRVDRVAGRARRIGDDDTLLTEQPVHETGLPHIGAPDDGDLYGAVFRGRFTSR